MSGRRKSYADGSSWETASSERYSRRERCSTNALTEEWLQKAEGDLRTAQRELAATEAPNFDAVAFHAQQATEKSIKAVLQQRGTDFPKTHHLADLVRLMDPPDARLMSLLPDLGQLSAAAVEVRYPGAAMNRERASRALQIAARVRGICLELLGLEP